MENTVQKTDSATEFMAVQNQLDDFIAQRNSLVLATHDAQGECELGVAPCVHVDGAFAVLLSQLAPHTRHLETEPRLNVMFLQDEADLRQPFARQRLVLSCDAARLERADARSDALFEQMESCFGSIVPLLRGLADFHVFVLTPRSGRFVAGFGKAYRLEGLQVAEHLRG